MAKQVTPRVLLGQQGVNLIEGIVLEMGWLWYSTGQVEAGIDGFVELRDPQSGEVTNNILQVQSKATDKSWEAETAAQFVFRCDEKDLDYWMGGNAPVLLVCSRPRTNEAYWISIKDCFKDPVVRKARKVVFDKKRDRLDASARQRLVALAVPRDSGIYIGAPPLVEGLTTNLLEVRRLPGMLHHAMTELGSEGQVVSALIAAGVFGCREWLVRSGAVLSVFPLDQEPWASICDLGTYETFDTSEWAESDDPVRRREFVQLLNSCLRAKLTPLGIGYWKKRDTYYFRATQERRPRKVHYQAQSRRPARTVFRGYQSSKKLGRISYYRHAAFEGRFIRADGRWFLEVVPTYFFTSDGTHPSRFMGSLLSGIKRLEHNNAVLSQLRMWADFLSTPPDMFGEDYPHLSFGYLIKVEVPAGVDDGAWLPQEEPEAAVGDAEEYGLFKL